MPKAPPPSVLLKFQGRRDYPLEKENDDWGLTPAQQESYVEQFRRSLAAKEAWREEHHDYFILRRFLRARSYDLEKATLMWLNHLKWKEDFQVDTILQDFYFNERDAFIDAYPQGYHKRDKMGRPVYIQHLGKISMAAIKKTTTEDRMLKFHIQEYERCRKVILPICSRLAGRHIDQTFGIMDVKGVGMGHLTGEVKRLLQMVVQYDQDNYPEMLGHICVINAPAVFRMLWSIVKGYMDVRTQNKVEILGVDYKAALLKWVDADNLPSYLGGTSEGTLQDDKGPWNDEAVLAEIGMDVEDLRTRHLPPPPPPGTFPMSESMRKPSLRDAASASMRKSTHDAAGHTLTNGGSARIASMAVREMTIPELGAARLDATPSKKLVERISALERLFPPHMERLKPNMPEANGSVDAGASGAVSTRSAPEGSLLHRIEVLEESYAALLSAQEVSLEYQQHMEQAGQGQKTPKEEACCCVVM